MAAYADDAEEELSRLMRSLSARTPLQQDSLCAEWRVRIRRKIYGPYSESHVREMISRGQIKASDFVCKSGGSPQWVKAKNDPVLGILFLGRSKNAPPRSGRRVISASVSAFALAGLLWIAWPYYSLYELTVALQKGDALSLESEIDWNSVREGLRGDLNAMLLKSLRSDKSGAGGGLAAVLGPAIINQMVDGYVTPQTIAYLIRDGKPMVPQAVASKQAGQRSGPQYTSEEIASLLNRTEADRPSKNGMAAPADGNRKSEQRSTQFEANQIRYAFFSGGPFSFKVEILPANSQTTDPVTLLFKWSGSWKLTRVVLPQDAFEETRK